MKWSTTHVFIILSILFMVYTFSVYFGTDSEKKQKSFDRTKASEGQMVWQAYNCQSCHQLYGLGGYLGPDLTNVISDPRKGEIVIRALIKSGNKQMPAFDISDTETDMLIEFLKLTDASGIADPRNFTSDHFGMIEENERK
jgi:nitric oxide reductase subunit C